MNGTIESESQYQSTVHLPQFRLEAYLDLANCPGP